MKIDCTAVLGLVKKSRSTSIILPSQLVSLNQHVDHIFCSEEVSALYTQKVFRVKGKLTMSFNHHARTFQPNTGEDFMRSNFHYVNTARTSSPNNISFHGKSGTKRYLFAALALTLLLLIAAIVIIILFATGVFEKEAATLSPYVPTPAPNIDVYVNRTFECEMYILKQASSYYDEPNNSLTIQARRMANEAISSVMSRTALGSLGLRTELTDLQNSGDDLRLRFLMSIVVPSRSQIDANVVRNNVLTPRTIADLSLAMNGVAFDTNPNRILVTQV